MPDLSDLPDVGRSPGAYGRGVRSPWQQRIPLEADREYVALASLIPPRSCSATWRLFQGSRAVTAQLRETPGVVGFSLLARPWRKQYATLSIWLDETSLAAFASSPPHRDLMASLGPEMAPTAFTRWTTRGADGRPSWREALRRLDAVPTIPSADGRS